LIFIDYREKKSRIPFLLEKYNVPSSIVELPVADYIIGDIAVERKEIGDYIQSKTSGHLDKQLYNLSTNFSLSYLIITGWIEEELQKRNISRQTYISSLVGSSLKRSPDGKSGQIITVTLRTDEDCALFLKYLHDKIEKGKLVRLPKMEKVSFSKDERAVHVLCSLPGVGEKKAKELLKTYGSLFNVFYIASVRDLSSVRGIGEKQSRELKELLTHEYRGE